MTLLRNKIKKRYFWPCVLLITLSQIAELEDEEISAYDIIERAKDETGVDVSEIAKGGQRT